MLHSGQPSIQILICSYNGCGGGKKKRKKAGKPISPTSCTAIPGNDEWLISEQSPQTYRNRPVWLGYQINKPVTHFLDGWQRFCRHSNSPIQLALSQPQAPEEEELGLVSSSFITNSEWGGGTGRVASCTRCWPELHSQMPWKQQAACILLITFLGVSGLVGAVTRTYHIGIVEEYWDYVPQGKNIITGKSFAEDKWVSMGSSETPRFGFLFTDTWKVVFLGWW